MEISVYIVTVVFRQAIAIEGCPGNHVTKGGKLILSHLVSRLDLI